MSTGRARSAVSGRASSKGIWDRQATAPGRGDASSSLARTRAGKIKIGKIHGAAAAVAPRPRVKPFAQIQPAASQDGAPVTRPVPLELRVETVYDDTFTALLQVPGERDRRVTFPKMLISNTELSSLESGAYVYWSVILVEAGSGRRRQEQHLIFKHRLPAPDDDRDEAAAEAEALIRRGGWEPVTDEQLDSAAGR